MMFSSSCNNNNNGDSDCFGAYDDGSISSSSFQQVGSSFITTPANLLEDDDQYFFLDQLLSMSQGQQQQFSLGYDTDPVQLALTDYNNNDFLDGMMLVAGKDQKISCDIEEVEEVAAPSQTKAIIDSSSNCGEICRNYCDKPAVKRSPVAKRIRSGKKDRHSKIRTAQGPRDRRMRLSLQVARKFFDLQDKLRFDRASKTIEWLFHMSKNAIKEVMASRIMDLKNNLESSLCENEEDFVSKCDHITTNFEDTDSDKFKIRINKQRMSTSKKSKRNDEEARCPKLKKDVRDKARAWARDRTVEKMRLRAGLKYPSQGLLTTLEKAAAAPNPSNTHSYSEQIGYCSAFEHLDSGAQSQSVEELIHYSDLKIDNARFYSRMF